MSGLIVVIILGIIAIVSIAYLVINDGFVFKNTELQMTVPKDIQESLKVHETTKGIQSANEILKRIVEKTPQFELPNEPIMKRNIQNLTNQELYEYALKLVNEDRQKFGAKSVELGTNPSAQDHASDMLEVNYFSHWNSKGVKPYVTFTEFGGRGNVAENVATTFSKCPTINCVPSFFEPLKEIKDHEYAMMYDDAHSNWGHRDNIINPYHTHVNFGIAYDNDNFYFTEHFETNIIDWKRIELVNEKDLKMVGSLPDGFSLNHIAVFADKKPKTLSEKILDEQSPYNLNYYDSGRLVGMIVERPPPTSYYKECQMGKITVTNEVGDTVCVDYTLFDDKNSDTDIIDISVDVSNWTKTDGLHTIYVSLNTPNGDQMDATSITLEYLK